MTPPRFRCCLDGKDPDGVENAKVLLFAAMQEEALAALAVAAIYEEVGSAELFSFEIKEEFRSEELGIEMLQKLEEAAFQGNVLIITYFLRKTDPISPLILKILERKRWSAPKLFMTRYFFDTIASHPPFYDYPLQLPAGYQIFPWKNLRKEERRKLLKQYDEGHFSALVSPFHQEEKIEPLNSLGLRYKGEVIGWVITHKISSDTLKYASFYVRPEFRYKGVSMCLMVDSMKRQQRSTVKWSVIEVNAQDRDSSWGKIVDKRLKRFAFFIDEIYLTWKAASPDVFKLP